MRADPGSRRLTQRPPRVVLGRVSKRALAWTLGPLALLLLLHAFVIGTLHVVGTSMADTLEPADLVLVSKLPSGLRRGDVVAFHLPRNPSLLLVKRVVAIGGDHDVIERGALRVRDAGGDDRPDPALDGHAHARLATTAGSVDVVVPSGALFVLGDNRAAGASNDSRDWGSLPSDAVIGRVVMRLHPFGRAGWL